MYHFTYHGFDNMFSELRCFFVYRGPELIDRALSSLSGKWSLISRAVEILQTGVPTHNKSREINKDYRFTLPKFF